MFSFLGIGAQKAGTTWLYAMLARHGEIDFPGPREHAFWDTARHPNITAPGPKEHHFWNTLSACDPAAIAGYMSRFDDPNRFQGELTPAYALLSRERIAAIREVAPRIRLIFLIRNPIERAWSSALMALTRAEMMRDEASDQWFIDHFHSAGSLARGDYAATLRAWRSVFPSEQLHIELYDSIVHEPRALLSRVAQHIGVNPAPFEALPDDIIREKVFSGPGNPLPNTLRQVLESIYRPRINALSVYLGRGLPWV